MDELLFIGIGLVLGGIIGFLLAKMTFQHKAVSSDETQSLQKQLFEREKRLAILTDKQATTDLEITHFKESLKEKQSEILEISQKNSYKESEIRNLREKLETQKEEISQMQEYFRKEFKLLANEIMEEKSKRFSDQNKEQISQILDPLKLKISEFEKKVDDTNKEQLTSNATLTAQIENLRLTNQQITKEAENLTKALRGDKKAQGNWGEMQLELILEKVGLEKDIHYLKESNFKNEEGNNQRLDYIIKMPDQKFLVLDSKVSLNAYTEYFNEEDEGKQQIFLKKHIESIHEHIKGLSSKNYHKLYEINQPDYVMMFVANEPALTIALKQEPSLYEKALEQNIVLVSTTTLMATLRTISYIWKQDLQNKNAMEIARQAGDLYDKFTGFTEDLLKVGSQLDATQKTYDDAVKKLSTGRGNLVSKVEKLRIMGAKTEKQINGKLLE